MIIYAKIRRSIDYTDFILLNVHPAEITGYSRNSLYLMHSLGKVPGAH